MRDKDDKMVKSIDDIAGSGASSMNRRGFLAAAGAGLAALLIPGKSRSEANCNQNVACDFYGNCMPDGTTDCDIRAGYVTYFQAQKGIAWCWAACVQMIFNYWGYNVSQERIVAETKGVIIDQTALPSEVLRALNRGWVSDSGEAFGISGYDTPGNWGRFSFEVGNDRPVIHGALGHATVLTGMHYKRTNGGDLLNMKSIDIIDPMMGPRNLSGQEYMNPIFGATITVFPDKRVRY